MKHEPDFTDPWFSACSCGWAVDCPPYEHADQRIRWLMHAMKVVLERLEAAEAA